VLTLKAFRHIGVAAPAAPTSQLFMFDAPPADE
jgi:hypothetical protein